VRIEIVGHPLGLPDDPVVAGEDTSELKEILSRIAAHPITGLAEQIGPQVHNLDAFIQDCRPHGQGASAARRL